jgi:hypothetical protein
MNVSNSHSNYSKRAILYARISTEEQAKNGYSLAQQLEALRGVRHSRGVRGPGRGRRCRPERGLTGKSGHGQGEGPGSQR